MGDRLKLALTKGRLQTESLRLMTAAGLQVVPLEKIGRRLIIELDNYPLDIVLAKAADVVTYVERGVCDMGIVGKDTIMEHGRRSFEALDMGFGRCRFVLAAKGALSYENLRVASKYPRVTRDFFQKKGYDPEIIKIEGSLELTPALGLADAILDIVETGSTLRENGLSEIVTVCDISARLLVNIGSMRMKKQRIDEFIDRLKAAL